MESSYKKDNEANWHFTTFQYNKNGMVDLRLENGERDGNGVQTKAPKRVELTYDQSDFMTRQLEPAARRPPARTTSAPTRRTSTRAGSVSAPCAAAPPAAVPTPRRGSCGRRRAGRTSTTASSRTLTTKDGNGRTTEAHDVGYFSGGRYEDGNRVTDSYLQLTSETADPDASGQICTATQRCDRKYTYDARGKVILDQIRAGLQVTYKYDEAALPRRRPDPAGGQRHDAGEGRPHDQQAVPRAPG